MSKSLPPLFQPLPTPGIRCPRCVELEGLLVTAVDRVSALEQQVRELEARLQQNSSNSSKPPSSDPPSAPPRPTKGPSGRRRGGQPGHPGHSRTRLPPERVNRTVDHVPESCRGCGAALPPERQPNDPAPTWHQVMELPPVLVEVTEHLGHSRTCPCCGEVTTQAVPAEVRQHVLGPRLTALMSYLSGRCHDGRRVVEEFLRDALGAPVSLGTICNHEAEVAAALAPAYAEAAAAVQEATSRNVDETGWGKDFSQAPSEAKAKGGSSRKGKKRWLWAAAAKAVAVFAIGSSRGSTGLEAVLGSDCLDPPGVDPPSVLRFTTSDRYSTYNRLAVDVRQICWAHLLRDFTKWSELGGHSGLAMVMGSDGRAVAHKALALWREYREGKIDLAAARAGLEKLRARMKQILRGGCRLDQARDKKAAAFCANLLAIEPALWTFMSDAGVAAGVEPTNNHAERCLRLAVMWRKNCFGSVSDIGCRFVERMLTVVTTLRLRGQSVLDFLARAVESHRAGLPAPSLLV